MTYVEINGIAFHYVAEGRGEPLLLLGGTLGTARGDFAPQIAAFSPVAQVIAPDRRGYGQTRPPARDFPLDFYQRDAHDMAALMSALQLAPVTVLGWSEGADVALCLAALHPERVKRLVVWGGIAAVDAEDIAIFEARRDVTTWPSRARDALQAAYGDGYWQPAWQAWCDVMAQLHALGGDARLGELERISCPVLIVHGRRDPLIRSVHPALLRQRIARSVAHEIEEGGHNLHLTHAATFNHLIEGFVMGVSG